MKMHDDQIDISDEVARELIVSQFPEWAPLPVRRFESRGTVNAIFRIGGEFAARFPLRAADPVAMLRDLEEEAQAIAEFSRHSPVSAPSPVCIGSPGATYPLPWSVQTWLPGTTALDNDPSRSLEFARDLAALVAALRLVSTAGRSFKGCGRGGDLHGHDEWVEASIRQVGPQFVKSQLAELWNYFRDLPRTSQDAMTHGDLTPLNILADRGQLVGILDCGGFGPADPSLDVIAGWHLLDDGPREVFRSELNCDELEWERSKAWTFEQSLGAVCYYVDSNPAMYNMGCRSLRRILDNTPARGLTPP